MQRQRIQTPAGVVAQETIRDAGHRHRLRCGAARGREQGLYRHRFPARNAENCQHGERAARANGFALGAVSEDGSRDERGIGSASASRASETRRVWVKVEEIGN